jgi:hypothetical protein
MKTIYLAKEPGLGVRDDLSKLQEEVVVVDCLGAYSDYYRKKGYNCISNDELFSLNVPMTINFSSGIGNPPYSDRGNINNSNKAPDLDSRFFLKLIEICDHVSLIIRSKHFTNSKSTFRRKLFSTGKVVSIKSLPKNTFRGIQNTETCIVTWNRFHSGPTKIEYFTGEVIEKVLTKDCLLKLDNPDFIDEVPNNLAHRWCRGKLTRSNFIDGDSPVIEVIGRNETPAISKIKEGQTIFGKNTHGVIMNHAAEWGGLGKIMVKPYELPISNSIIMLTTNTEEEAIILRDYLMSDEVRETIKSNMPSFHPTKDLFKKITDPLNICQKINTI